MTKVIHLALLCIAVIIGLLISPVAAVATAPGTPIEYILPGGSEHPDIDGNTIVFERNLLSGPKDIYYMTISGDAHALTDDEFSQERPSISGDHVVWQENQNGDWDVRLYSFSTNKTILLTEGDPANQWLPVIHGNYVVWYDDSEGDTNIVLYDISTEEKKTIVCNPDLGNDVTKFKPALSDEYVAWGEVGGGIWLYEIATEDRRAVSPSTMDQLWPSIYGSLIAWEDYRWGENSWYSAIYIKNLDTDDERQLTTLSDEQVSPALSESLIAWEDKRDGQWSIYMYDLAGGVEEMSVPTTGGEQLYPAVSGNTIVWQKNRGEFAHICVYIYRPGDPVHTVTEIEIEPSTAMVDIGVELKFNATCYDEDGDVIPGRTVTWTCDNETVGYIDPGGYFLAYRAGTTTVTASAGGINGTATVTVTDETPAEPELTTITVNPATATLAIGDTKQFTATAFDQFGLEMSDAEFDWTCSNAIVGSIDNATGLFTALAEGTATVTASAGGISGTATVTVGVEDPIEPVLANIVITPPRATLDVDDIQRFIVTGYDQNGNAIPAGEVIWSSGNETVGTIDEDGFFTALAAGTATVTATSGDAAVTAEVTVNKWPALARIVVVPSAATLKIGDELEFCAIAFDRFGNIVPGADISWECCSPCVGDIDACGVFTALDSGTATIIACSGSTEGTATVTVNDNCPVLTRIAVTPSAITLAAGDTAAFTATAFDQDGCPMPGVEIEWDCCDGTVGEVDDTGFFTALGEGSTTVTASAGCISGTAEIEVTDESTGVVVSPSAIILNCGDEWRFTATVHDLLDNSSDPTIAWSCEDTDVGEIDDDGLFTARGAGGTIVTATVDEETGTATVTVLSASPEPARIEVSPSDFFIPAGETLLLTATVYDQYGFPMDIDVEWESSDPCIGTIDGCGLFTAHEAGEVRLIASVDGVCGSACVTVEPSIPAPACIEIDPATAALAPGETREFTATVFDQCNQVMDWVGVAWSCSDDCVGTIDRSGLFAAFMVGSTDVTACAGGVGGTASVTVTTTPTAEPTPRPTPGSGGFDGSDSGGDSGPTFYAGICENLRGGETHTFSGIGVTSVGSIAVTASNTIPRMLMTVKGTGCPNLAERPGDTYEYIEIAVSWANPRDISNATITFTIPAKWLDEHDILPEDIRLMRYVDGGWQILETRVIGEEDGIYHFRATTPGFSTFAIAAAPENNEITPVETVPTVTEETNVTNVTTGTTEEPTTEATTVSVTTAPAAPLIYAPLLAPLAFLLWRKKKN